MAQLNSPRNKTHKVRGSDPCSIFWHFPSCHVLLPIAYLFWRPAQPSDQANEHFLLSSQSAVDTSWSAGPQKAGTGDLGGVVLGSTSWEMFQDFPVKVKPTSFSSSLGFVCLSDLSVWAGRNILCGCEEGDEDYLLGCSLTP